MVEETASRVTNLCRRAEPAVLEPGSSCVGEWLVAGLEGTVCKAQGKPWL